MIFSIYDYKNKFLPGSGTDKTESDLIYVGPTKTEWDYRYMRGRPGTAGSADDGIPGGGQIKTPYVVEFTVPEDTAATPVYTLPITLTVYGAALKKDATSGSPFKADGSPLEPADTDFKEVGVFKVSAYENIPYRIAISDSAYKWFKVSAIDSTATTPIAVNGVYAFLARG